MSKSISATIEELESRRLLSGNVSVLVYGGTFVTVTGDKKSNSINTVITQYGIQIFGLNGTTLNGYTNVLLPSTVTSWKFDMGNGDDTVIFSGQTGFSFQALMGSGNDTLQVDHSSFNTLIIDAGADDDTVLIANDTIALGGINLDANTGNDQVTLDTTTVQGNVAVKLGTGNDILTIHNPDPYSAGLIVTGTCTFDGGKNTDELRLMNPVNGVYSQINIEATLIFDPPPPLP